MISTKKIDGKQLNELFSILKERIDRNKKLNWFPVIKIESGVTSTSLLEKDMDIDVVNFFDIRCTRLYIAQTENLSWRAIMYKDRNVEEKLLNPGVLFDDENRELFISDYSYISDDLCIVKYTREKWDYLRDISKNVRFIRDTFWNNIE